MESDVVTRGMVLTKSATLAIAWLASLALFWPRASHAQHACDAIGEEGWRVVATNEVTDVKDSAPYRMGGDWVLDRTTRLLPLCNYFNDVGNYSLRSYSLDPYDKTARVMICHDSAAVAPYAGPCPPK